MTDNGIRRVYDAVPKINEGEKSIMFFTAHDPRTRSQRFAKAGPEIEGPATESHVATNSNSTKTCALKPKRGRLINDPPLLSQIDRIECGAKNLFVGVSFKIQSAPCNCHHLSILERWRQAKQPAWLSYSVIIQEGNDIRITGTCPTIASAAYAGNELK
jgi:hypothetical protein